MDDSVCTKPADFPSEHYIGAVSSRSREEILLCGGEKAGKLCHGYNFSTQAWTRSPFALVTERSFAAGVTLANGTWIVIGGKDFNGRGLPTTENFDGSRFMSGLQWPEAVSGHCMALINTSHVFLAGGDGQRDGSVLNSAYFLEAHNSHWDSVGKRMRFGRSGHVCGVVGDTSSMLYAVVAGGLDTVRVEMLELLSGSKWVSGPDLPHEMNLAASFQLFDGVSQSMLIAGGEHIGYCSKSHLCYSSNSVQRLSLNEGRLSWETIPQTMNLPRSKHLVVTIPAESDICQRTCSNCSGTYNAAARRRLFP